MKRGMLVLFDADLRTHIVQWEASEHGGYTYCGGYASRHFITFGQIPTCFECVMRWLRQN